MEYHYISPDLTSKELDCELLFSKGKTSVTIPIVCYHVNTEASSPFLQILLEDNNVSGFGLPFVSIPHNTSKEVINNYITLKVKVLLSQLVECKEEICVEGYFMNEETCKCVAFVNITNIDIHYLEQQIDNEQVFVLINDIINEEAILNTKKISQNTINLFSMNKDLCLLYTTKARDKYYDIPDTCYTIDEVKKAKFKLIFGQTPSTSNEYHFFTTLDTCLEQLKNNPTPNHANVSYGLVRYAVFNADNSYGSGSVTINKYEDLFPLSYYNVIKQTSTNKYIVI